MFTATVSAAMANDLRIDSDYQTYVLGNDLPRGLPRLEEYLRNVNRARRARHKARRNKRGR